MSISLVSSWSEIVVPSETVRAPTNSDGIKITRVSESVQTTPVAEPPAASAEQVNKAIEKVNETLNNKGQNLYAALETDKATGINIVKFLDKSTKEVISQFPSKEILAMAAAMESNQDDKGQLLYVSA